MEFYAHLSSDKKLQTLKEHCKQTALYCSKSCEAIGMQYFGELIGWLHDAGKATKVFQDYLFSQDISQKGKINHSSCASRYLTETFGDGKQTEQITAAMASAAMCGHHSGLPDIISISGEHTLEKRIFPSKEIYYSEAIQNFFNSVISEQEIKNLFLKATLELKVFMENVLVASIKCHVSQNSEQNIKIISERSMEIDFLVGMLERFLHSALIDADRYDTYLFYGGNPDEEWDTKCFWNQMTEKVEAQAEIFSENSENTVLNTVRQDISQACSSFADKPAGVYQLSVPTGAGKTQSSLRMAVNMTAKRNLSHIYYIAPFKTILEQNAKEIREVLQNDRAVLEHHSDVIPGEDFFDSEYDEEISRYTLLTQRYTSPVILTTMVQFLNTLFSTRSACDRRFHSLANSVIILDEVQSVPIRFVSMLNMALNFLSSLCGCTIVLCTATQPEFSLVKHAIILGNPAQIVPNSLRTHAAFSRTNIVDMTTQDKFSPDSLADFALKKVNDVGSVLIILNTKSVVKNTYSAIKNILPPDVLLYHLSTSLCAAHRMKLFDEMKNQLKDGKKIICVSTRLIEAGVDISFDCVVRSLAGIDSVAQAAGRCNRNGKTSCRDVFLIRMEGEKLDSLPDIKAEQESAKDMLGDYRRNPDKFKKNLLSAESIKCYYEHYYHNYEYLLDYPVKNLENSVKEAQLFDLLSQNTLGVKAALKDKSYKVNQMFCQAFQTAGKYFYVIPNFGTDVLVPYGQGKEIIEKIESKAAYKDMPMLLRKAQRYTVHIFDYEEQALEQLGGIHFLEDSQIAVLDERFYDEEQYGLCLKPRQMDTLLQ